MVLLIKSSLKKSGVFLYLSALEPIKRSKSPYISPKTLSAPPLSHRSLDFLISI